MSDLPFYIWDSRKFFRWFFYNLLYIITIYCLVQSLLARMLASNTSFSSINSNSYKFNDDINNSSVNYVYHQICQLLPTIALSDHNYRVYFVTLGAGTVLLLGAAVVFTLIWRKHALVSASTSAYTRTLQLIEKWWSSCGSSF